MGGKPAGEGKLLTIFEGMDQFVDRKIIGMDSEHAVKRRRLRQAAPTALTEGGVFQAQRTVRRR